jgi:hypothetical protein
VLAGASATAALTAATYGLAESMGNRRLALLVVAATAAAIFACARPLGDQGYAGDGGGPGKLVGEDLSALGSGALCCAALLCIWKCSAAVSKVPR